MNKCKICNKETKNKVYCSTECQYNGYRELKLDRINCDCLYCGKKFETLQNKLDNGKKYCSRFCKDKHQKELYLKDGNPVYGKIHTDEWKFEQSIKVKELWKKDDFKQKVKTGQENFFNENGFWCGSDERSLKKRELTFLREYCVKNISEVKEIRTKADETCLKKYGKTSFELLLSGRKKNRGTNIEVKISKILIETDIKFETQYEINVGETFRIYDFYLPEFNLLIEADGDYWHGNPNKFTILNEVQSINKINDIFKNELAKENGFSLIRFWETDIKKKNFKFNLMNKIKQYAKKN